MSNSPQLWAAADLDPVSPAPVYPSSPVIVPILQDRADTYFNMSPSDNTFEVLPEANATVAAQAHEQTCAPIITTQNNAPNNVSGPVQIGLEGTGLDNGTNSMAANPDVVPVGNSAEHMQEPETSYPAATAAKQNVSTSNGVVHPTMPALEGNRTNIAAPAQGNGLSTPQLPLNLAPAPLNAPQNSQENSRISSDPAVSDQNTNNFVQPPSKETSTNRNHGSDATSLAGHSAADIQAILDNITARAAAVGQAHIDGSNSALDGSSRSQNTVLPAKPPVPDSTRVRTFPPTDESSLPGAAQPSSTPSLSGNGLGTNANAAAAPRTFIPHVGAISKQSIIPVPDHAVSLSQADLAHATLPVNQSPLASNQKQQWETFVQEERNYMSEAQWNLFPEGSRLFIGNLSIERVSKKDVFNLFSQYGRLAQISLKQAYGFVQYHTAADGQTALNQLQGFDLGGKKINVETSRAQKKDGDSNHPGRGGRRNSIRQDTGKGRQDTYRPTRQSSGHQKLPSSDGNSRGRGYRENSFSNDRHRSQSPGHGTYDSYRRRDPSPSRRPASIGGTDTPFRYGPEVPDVQFILLQDVKRDFVAWVEGAFVKLGLRVGVMFMNPQFPRDTVIKRQVMEGVHAVVELDARAQEYGMVRLQVFDRSAGFNNVRFDQYQDIEPTVAAQLTVRVKSQPQQPTPYGGNPYPPAQQYLPYLQGPYVHQPHPNQPYPPQNGPGAARMPFDTAAVQNILGSFNNGSNQNNQQAYAGRPSTGGPPPNGPSADVNRLLATLSSNPQGMRSLPPLPPTHGLPQNMPPAAQGGNPAQHVNDIMSQFARFRK